MALGRPDGSTDEEYLQAIRDLAEELEKTPSWREMNEHGDYAAVTITDSLYCTWNEAVERAGLVPNECTAENGGGHSGFGLEDLDPSDVGLSPMEGGSP